MLIAANVEHTVHQFEAGKNNFGSQAAQELGLPETQVFKTLVVELSGKTTSGLAVACVPVANSLNLKAVAKALGASKATMADPHKAQLSTGYIPGGISPFGQKRQLPTLLDSHALDFDRIYVSGGKRGLDIGLAPQDLLKVLSAKLAPIAC
ncbi:Cys-tRNA(Pro)/Cys-tRNA(Cys) deacylase YbaK [Corynebacterium pseudopelargi]|uniref:Cys-tRNA(Pro)/Cys-tRNA(Cys) deacylase n=2 Tax=Corynebacterium pseudopelargi TaxID=2080757 RepID=A0A3G6IVI9_9CORY|nr:Cys-tRNA(Pro)/Cys-tRNA(Cys) deacylase YbaK [Corynebacterium pseudopelargi]